MVDVEQGTVNIDIIFLYGQQGNWLHRAGEPEPLEKKTGAGAAWKKSEAGAGAAKKLAGSSALREDKKLKEIVL